MPVLNTLSSDHGAMPVIGARINPVLTYQRPGYLRPTQTNTIAESGPGADPAVRRLTAAHPTLATLAEQDRRVLLRWSRIRKLKRREVICRQGDPAGSVLLVLEGYLKLSTPLADGGEVLLEIAGPGDCAGELTAMQDRPHDVNLTTLSECRLLMIDARQFRQAFDRHPEGLLAIMRTAARRIQKATEQMLDGRTLTAPARLAKALLYLARLPSAAPNATASLSLRLSQGELGSMTGMCREVVNKHLGTWRDAGWVQMSGGTVTRVDVAEIANLLQDDVFEEVEKKRAYA